MRHKRDEQLPDGTKEKARSPMYAAIGMWARLKGMVCGAVISDMADYRNNNSHHNNYLWRTIDVFCKE